MRIIVGNDYYDNAVVWGRDTTITFLREHEHYLDKFTIAASKLVVPSFAIKIIPKDTKISWRSMSSYSDHSFTSKTDGYNKTFYVRPVSVVIADKQYFGIRASSSIYPYASDEILFWNLQSFTDWLDLHDHISEDDSSRWRYRGSANIHISNYFDVLKLKKESLDWMIEHKFSIVTYESKIQLKDNEKEWQANGYNLRKLQFYKNMDAFTIFQELSMWIGGVLLKSGNPAVEIIDNNIKIAKAGFDKFSFRNQKQKT